MPKSELELDSVSKFHSLVKKKACNNSIVRFRLDEKTPVREMKSLCATLALEGCPPEFILHVEKNKHAKEFLKLLCATLSSKNHLVCFWVHLAELDMGDGDIICIMDMLKSEFHPSNMLINLNRNKLTDETLKNIGDILRHKNCPEEIRLLLIDNAFSDLGLVALSQALASSSLKQDIALNLNGKNNTFTPAGIEQFNTSLMRRTLFPGDLHIDLKFVGSGLDCDLFLIKNSKKMEAIKQTAITCLHLAVGICKTMNIPQDVLWIIFAEVFPFQDLRNKNGKAYKNIFAANVCRYAFFTHPKQKLEWQLSSIPALLEHIPVKRR